MPNSPNRNRVDRTPPVAQSNKVVRFGTSATVVADGTANTIENASPNATTGTGTGGPPTGSAGGDLNGSYPNPGVGKLQGFTVSSATPSDRGTLRYLSSAWTPTSPDVFNVKDYGALGDGTTDDTTAINAACTACAAATNRGTVYFPDGVYKITAAITLTLTGVAAIKGNSRYSSIILCATNTINAIYCNLSGGTPANNRVEVADLGFRTAAATAPTCAVYIDYGVTNIASSENRGGSIVTRLDIWNNTGDTGGYINGAIFRNAWHAFCTDMYGYGCALSYSFASSPGAGDGGAGSGAMITFLSGVNYTIDRIQGDFWSQGIRLRPVSLVTAGQNQIAQGVLTSNWNFVAVVEALHAYTNSTRDSYDLLTIVNFQADLGNISLAANKCLYIEATVNLFMSAGLCLQTNGAAIATFDYLTNSYIVNVSFSKAAITPTKAIELTGNSNFNQFRDCGFDTMPISLSAGSGSNRINNTAGCTITNAGGGNLIGDQRNYSAVWTLTAAASNTFSISVATAGLDGVPGTAFCNQISGIPTAHKAAFDFGNAGNTATTLFFKVWVDTGVLTAGAQRFAITVGPGF